MFHLLIIDDEPTMLKGIELNFEDRPDYEVKTASDKKTALDLMEDHEFNLIVTDLMVPEIEDGLEIIKAASSQWYQPSVLAMTAFETVENAINTMKAGADDFISKGFGLDELTFRIENLITKKQKIDLLEFENRILNETMKQQYSDFKINGQALI